MNVHAPLMIQLRLDSVPCLGHQFVQEGVNFDIVCVMDPLANQMPRNWFPGSKSQLDCLVELVHPSIGLMIAEHYSHHTNSPTAQGGSVRITSHRPPITNH
jgi:hypothetical protein